MEVNLVEAVDAVFILVFVDAFTELFAGFDEYGQDLLVNVMGDEHPGGSHHVQEEHDLSHDLDEADDAQKLIPHLQELLVVQGLFDERLKAPEPSSEPVNLEESQEEQEVKRQYPL